jgi:hypothetical protein
MQLELLTISLPPTRTGDLSQATSRHAGATNFESIAAPMQPANARISAELVLDSGARDWGNADIVAMLNRAFDDPELERVVANVESRDSRLLSLLNRNGFQFLRTQWSNPSQRPFRLTMVYEITRERWSQSQKHLPQGSEPRSRRSAVTMLRSLAAKLRPGCSC